MYGRYRAAVCRAPGLRERVQTVRASRRYRWPPGRAQWILNFAANQFAANCHHCGRLPSVAHRHHRGVVPGLGSRRCQNARCRLATGEDNRRPGRSRGHRGFWRCGVEGCRHGETRLCHRGTNGLDGLRRCALNKRRLGPCLSEGTPLMRCRFSSRDLGCLSAGCQKYGNRTMGDLPCGVSCWREQEAKNHN